MEVLGCGRIYDRRKTTIYNPPIHLAICIVNLQRVELEDRQILLSHCSLIEK